MRIIGGTCKGRPLHPPKGLPVRPTTDFAKEALFNILNNQLDFEGIKVLDLFAGTGNMSLEFASRGAQVTAVDANGKCCSWMKNAATQLQLPVQVHKGDVFVFLNHSPQAYDLIFADPPYDLPQLLQLPEIIFSKGWLSPEGLLILEHGKQTPTGGLPHFSRERKYGNVHFSFFT
jgi:16S rRNA (guanine(966)-N(2))-methyltransferase RsmD